MILLGKICQRTLSSRAKILGEEGLSSGKHSPLEKILTKSVGRDKSWGW